jgi:hypothetical protein
VAIFIITSILTLLHVSGIRPLPNPEHGKILFKALILEIVIVAVAVFGKMLISENPKQFQSTAAGITIEKEETSGLSIPNPFGGMFEQRGQVNPTLPKTEESNKYNLTIDTGSGDKCREITIMDASTIPPTSRIETICE